MNTSKKLIRSKLLILTDREIQEMKNSTNPKFSLNESEDLYSPMIEIKLQDEFFKPDNKKCSRLVEFSPNIRTRQKSPSQKLPSPKRKVEILSPKFLRLKSTEIGITNRDSLCSDIQQSTKLIDESNNFPLIRKKTCIEFQMKKRSSFLDSIKVFNDETSLDHNNLMDVYCNFLGCLDSRNSIGFEKHKKFKGLINQNSNKSPKKSKKIPLNENEKNENQHHLLFENENKIDIVIDYLNRDKGPSDQDKKKKRVKEGIFYLQSLVYCLRIYQEPLQKSKKNKEEFIDFRKELLSPLINRRKSQMVNFEILKKVYLWKEENNEKLNQPNVEPRKIKNVTGTVKYSNNDIRLRLKSLHDLDNFKKENCDGTKIQPDIKNENQIILNLNSERRKKCLKNKTFIETQDIILKGDSAKNILQKNINKDPNDCKIKKVFIESNNNTNSASQINKKFDSGKLKKYPSSNKMSSCSSVITVMSESPSIITDDDFDENCNDFSFSSVHSSQHNEFFNNTGLDIKIKRTDIKWGTIRSNQEKPVRNPFKI